MKVVIVLFLFFLPFHIHKQENLIKLNKQSKDEFILIQEYFYNSNYRDVSKIILSIAILETGWFKSHYHKKFNNYFSLKDFKDKRCSKQPIYCLKQYESLEENLDDMLFFFESKKYPYDRNGFLKKLKHYAKDKNYRMKIENLENKMNKRFK